MFQIFLGHPLYLLGRKGGAGQWMVMSRIMHIKCSLCNERLHSFIANCR